MGKEIELRQARLRRHVRVRRKIFGTPERPRLNVFRSLHHVYAQIIDDAVGHTLVSASSLDGELRGACAGLSKAQVARFVGRTVAERALACGVTKVVFDRGGYQYHGRVKSLADAAREAGLEF